MSDQPSFDLSAAHHYFSGATFNKAWELMDKPERTSAEDAEMLRLSMVSTWHWMQREDCTAENLSIGYWQTSRIYVMLKQPSHAFEYAQMCLEAAQDGDVAPFYIAYAYEALARAEALAGVHQKKDQYLAEARRLLQQIEDPEESELIEADLNTI